jgi:hypothetical protein
MSSTHISDQKVIERFISDPDFPYLISFPRTGSHWLRMIMELYFEKPSLVRIFYYKNAKDFTCYHHHDEDLTLRRKNVIYLYRHPVDTIYSQLRYYKEDIDSLEQIRYWSELYGKHLSRWLVEENFTRKKTVLTYEGMKTGIYQEFKKICDHFSVTFNRERLQPALTKVTKTEVKRKTVHDRQVINMSHRYKIEKEKFGKDQSAFIMDCIYSVSKELKKFIMDPV